MERQVLKFHTGSGGQFYNPGYVTFLDFEKITEGNFGHFYTHDEEENKLYNANGPEIFDFEFNEDGTGYIDDDGQFDTTTCVFEDELTDKQLEALKRADHWNESEVERIINLYS